MSRAMNPLGLEKARQCVDWECCQSGLLGPGRSDGHERRVETGQESSARVMFLRLLTS